MKRISKKTIRHIALMNNKKNVSRSALVMMVIFLSTMLLTMITTYGLGTVNYERLSAEEIYGRFTGMFTDLDEEDLNRIRKDENITEIGLVHECGSIESDALISMKYLDEGARDMASVQKRMESGSYPSKEDEILVSRGLLKACGIPEGKIGDRISLSVRLDYSLPYETMDFTICGFLKEDSEDIEADTFGAFVSEDFYKNRCRTYEDGCSLLFNLSEDYPLYYEDSVSQLTEYAVSLGLQATQVTANTMYILLVLNQGKEILLACVFLILMVILFSMIVIYNIFQISLVQRMQEYGRLKAIGASRKQIRSLINQEGMMLALPVVPLGAVAGYITASFSFGWLIANVNSLQNRNVENFNLFSPIAFFGSMLMAFITVWLSMVKPKRKMASISAIEAIDYREGRGERRSRRKAGSGLRKGHINVNERSLAFANIAAGKRQAFTTILTMGLSCVMLVVMMNCLGNIDTEYEARKCVPHGQFELSLDYTFYDDVYPENNLDEILKEDPLNLDLVEELKNIPEVTDVTFGDVLVIEREFGQKEVINVISREDFDFERDKGGSKGSLDYDKASAEDQIMFGWSHFMGADDVVFGPMEYSLWNGKETRNFSSNMEGAFGSLVGGWAITEDTYQHFGYSKGSSIGRIWVDCAEADRAAVEEEIKEVISGRKHLELDSFEKNLKEQLFGTRVIRYSIYSLLIVIGFIGFMNMVNTMIISITTRRREYGIMQAVGMTGRQLSRSLILQGMIYILGTMVISLLVGIPLGYLAFVKFKKIAGFGMNVYHFPWLEILVMTLVLILMQLALSWILTRNVKKDSLVERIRY